MGGTISKSEPMVQVAPKKQRSHPQERFDKTGGTTWRRANTVIDRDSFFGQLRSLYSTKVLHTQLEQLRKQGSYDAFKLGWNPKYNIAKVKGGKCSVSTSRTSSTPTVGGKSTDSVLGFGRGQVVRARSRDADQRIEAACYFLTSPAGHPTEEYNRAINELVDMIVKAQQPDGYLGTYFTLVDRAGRLKNLRDMHEMSLAHHKYTGSRKFLNAMIGYVELLMKLYGPGSNQRHGYPGHPELELAVLRLYSETRDPRYVAFAEYMLAARGRREKDLGDKAFFVWEAEQRKDPVFHSAMNSIDDGRYHQWHAPLHEQDTILGHSVRALYLITGAADTDGRLLEDAKRLWADCIENKMYPTGGFGSIPAIEGFSEVPHFLPNAHDEGGCYAETCASIACMMVTERILSHGYDQKARDVLERCLLNNVLGGTSLDGKQFYYANRLATSEGENSDRNDWFDVCCCPPNLTRTMGMLGGYIWNAWADHRVIHLDVYVFASAKTTVAVSGAHATARMITEMPWKGRTTIKLDAPKGYTWKVNLPRPEYAENYDCSAIPETSGEITIIFDMPVRLIQSHPESHQDTLVVQRGPIVYAAESYDNHDLNNQYPHFAHVGITSSALFDEEPLTIGGIEMIGLASREAVYGLKTGKSALGGVGKVWSQTPHKVRLLPFFARANRATGQTLRTALQRVATSDIDNEIDEDARLRKIYEEEWEWRISQRMDTPTDDGDGKKEKDCMPVVDADSQHKRMRYWEEIIKRVDEINVERLSNDGRINHGVYRAQLEVFVDQIKFKEYEKPLNSMFAFWQITLDGIKDLGAFLGRLRDYPRFLDENITNMRAGLARGFTPPKVTLKGRDASIASIAQTKAEDSNVLKVFKDSKLQGEALKVMKEAVIPAYQKLLRFFREEYYPHCRETLAAYDLPNGKAYYRSKIKEFATLNLTAEQIHQIGLDGVKAITERMEATMKETGYKGTLAEFLVHLKTNPDFYPTSELELLKEACWIAKDVDGVLGDFFGTLPRRRFAIKPTPADQAPYVAAGMAGPNTFYLNTYDLKSRPLFGIPALTLHESGPGHSFQLGLALEHELPPFRGGYISAFGEGWGLYCEHLGQEMGIYHTPYQLFGMLSFQVWRAVRLVIDTGVHSKGWTRSQSLEFFAKYTATSKLEIEVETDRYISWPGQALAYYLGFSEILRLRRKAEKELGEKFDVKAYHDTVMAAGSVPMGVLEMVVDGFIAGHRK